MHVPELAPRADELAAVLPRASREGIVAVGEEQDALADLGAGRVVVEHLPRDVMRAEQGVVVGPFIGGGICVGVGGGADLIAEPFVAARAGEVCEVLDAPRRGNVHALLDPHALARAAAAVVVVVAAFGIVQPARVRRREERDALFVVRGGYDARAEHGSRALDRDVDERFRGWVVDASGPSDVVVARRSPSVTLAGAGRNMAGDASMRNTRDSRSDCGSVHAGRVVGRGISGWRRKGWHPGRR